MGVVGCFLDLNFVVDSSGSLSLNDWDIAKQFVVAITDQFTIGPDNVQVAFVLFSTEATVEWDLTRYRNKSNLKQAILDRDYLEDQTNLNDALYLTWTEVFAPGRGTRPGAIKVTIILTDGEDNVPVKGTPLTIQNATACKNDGIRLIAIGVSDKVNQQRMGQIVSDLQRDYYNVTDFSVLTSVVDQLRPEIICRTEPSIRSYLTCS